MNEIISIIVPIYKVEKYINECVNSLLNQTYKDLEIILVDDGSPDNCGKICDEYAKKDSRIKVIHKQNGGLSDARNKGMEIATGRYISFIDSDDYIPLDYYEIMMASMKKYDADLVASDIAWAYEDKKETPLPRFEEKLCNSEEALKTLIHGIGFCAVAWNKLYKRELLEGISYPVGRLNEDEFVTFKLLDRAQRLVLTQKTAYMYRQRSGSIMSSSGFERTDSIDAFFERLDLLNKKYPALAREDKATLSMILSQHYIKVLECKDKSKSEVKKTVKKKLKKYRKSMHISFKDLKTYSMKYKIYAIGSKVSLSVFCRLLNIVNG